MCEEEEWGYGLTGEPDLLVPSREWQRSHHPSCQCTLSFAFPFAVRDIFRSCILRFFCTRQVGALVPATGAM